MVETPATEVRPEPEIETPTVPDFSEFEIDVPDFIAEPVNEEFIEPEILSEAEISAQLPNYHQEKKFFASLAKRKPVEEEEKVETDPFILFLKEKFRVIEY